MSLQVTEAGPSIWQLKIGGWLKKSELDAAQEAGRGEIERVGNLKILLVLEDFRGWEPGANWGDITFAATYGDRIEKIAVVGDTKWETPMLMFVGAGCRRSEVKYFRGTDLAAARDWLSGEPK
jgi:hypothetical protein